MSFVDREVYSKLFGHAFSDEDAAYHNSWKAASGHPNGYRVVKNSFEKGQDGLWYSGQRGFIELEGKTGKLRLFKSFEAAKKVAEKLNREQKGR